MTILVDELCTGMGESPMSVEGVEGVFCVTGPACVADNADGACPGPQEGLEFGASCGKVITGVYGCKPNTAAPADYSGESDESSESEDGSEEEPTTLCTGMGESPMSVEGVEGVFCVTGPACVADNADGACPGPQEGLEFGASCGKVITGVYGCKPNTAAPADYSGESDESSESEDGSEEEPTTLCTGMGESPMSVEGVEGVFCVTGPACVADNADGACPGPQEGLEFGASCGKVITGVYGCKPNTAAPADYSGESDESSESEDGSEEEPTTLCTGMGESPMSVEGVEGVFCVTGPACVADNADGACPGPQEGLEFGASCGKVITGVYGCKPNTAAPADYSGESDESSESEDGSEEEPTTLCTGMGESPMSVEGVEGVFCVTGPACVADNADGACPGPQEGLEFGASCGKVITGVYGCKPNTAAPADYSGESDESSESEDGSEEEPTTLCTGMGESPMSVEGVEGVFCVTGPACVADNADGACPGPQEGLEFGASCGKVITGVYGCKPNGAPKDEDKNDSVDSIDTSLLCAGEGRSQMSVEGVTGIFCVSGSACVADNADGACPGPQEGLPNGSECGKVATGVYGCKPTAVTRLRHKKHSSKSDKHTATKDKKTKHQHKKTHHTNKH
uniref:Uncharacterized protein n=1 Tax=Globisporangium ultimum (strain ATCC 200006 / CBS 805.95 / DAOM BR144) TaxID=431595 RepID=K3W956_GLOUD